MNMRYVYGLLLAGILLFFAGTQVFLSYHENQTIDEGVHISAGLSYLVTGDFRLNPEHPALLKEFAALPLLFIDAELPLDHDSWENADQWKFAREFFYGGINNPDTILRASRMVIIMISILLGALISRWAYERYGWKSSLIATLMYATSPLILTHGHLVTTDLSVAFGITASCYFFVRVLQRASWLRILFLSLSVAWTVTTKFSGLIIVPLLLLSYAAAVMWFRAQYPQVRSWKTFFKIALPVLIVSIVAVGITTGFNATQASQDEFHGQAQIQTLYEESEKTDGVQSWFLENLANVLERTSLPGYPYIIGFLEFTGHFTGGHDTFFLGEHSKNGNPWYFPVAFLIKTRFGILVLLSLILALLVKRAFSRYVALRKINPIKKTFSRLFSGADFESIMIAFVPILYLGISMTSNINIGARHILPVYPFIFLGISFLFSAKLGFHKRLRQVLWSIIIVTCLSGFVTFPYTMAYYSEVIGGAKNGQPYMMDSNLDWGQNLKYLRNYMDAHGIDEVCYSYFGQGNFDHEGISGRYLPTSDEIHLIQTFDCFVAISAESLFGKEHRYDWLLTKKVEDTIGYGIYLFDLRR